MSFVGTSSCLCITLKRFSGNRKINSNIEISPVITVSKHFADIPVISSNNYKLVSVINHVGMTRCSGHYTANLIDQENNFYEFDDTTVRKIDQNSMKGNDAYVLFYECVERVEVIRNFPKCITNHQNCSLA